MIKDNSKKEGKRNFFSKNPKLIVKDTKKYGKGVFAEEDIKKESVIYVLGGKKMSPNVFYRVVNSNKEDIDDPLQIGKRTYIDLDKFSRSFNHSCNPNAGIRKSSEMFALTNINKGEQITFDYSSTIAPTKWKMKCKCGSKNCRKILGDILSIPEKQLDYYKKVGALQKYMKLILKETETNTYKIPKYELLLLENLKRTDNIN